MSFATLSGFPLKLSVEQCLSSRYPNNERPDNWDDRCDGVDVVRTIDGKVLKLWSDGQQSPPKAGWDIMVSSEVGDGAYRWTLYSLGH